MQVDFFFTLTLYYIQLLFLFEMKLLSPKDIKKCVHIVALCKFSAMTIGCVCILVLHQLCHHLSFSLMSILFYIEVTYTYTHTHRCGKVSSVFLLKQSFVTAHFREGVSFFVYHRAPSVGQKWYMRGQLLLLLLMVQLVSLYRYGKKKEHE